MKKRQQKSACCQAVIWQHGNHRRRCSACNRTWTAWPRRPGPKPRRPDDALTAKYLNHELGALSKQAPRYGLTPQAIQKRARKSRDASNRRQDWLGLPAGDLILVADGLRQVFGSHNEVVTVYILLLRPADSSRATILPPVVLTGSEGQTGWALALETIPLDQRQRIRAVVCDGTRGLILLARAHGWIVQRCHFHAWQAINNYLRPTHRSKQPELSRTVHNLVRVLLSSPDDEKATRAAGRLSDLALLQSNHKLKTVLKGLAKYWLDYRSYLYYDELNLPSTSNTAEVCISVMRALQSRARGFRTKAAFVAWLELTFKTQQTVKCQAKTPQELVV